MTDVGVIGGGLAGLINAILLSRAGLSVTLYERKTYPFHRVCGEYISKEVVPFLKKHQLYPDHVDIPNIDKFTLTSTNGSKADLNLDMGGFGISRYTLDEFLYREALKAGVQCQTGISVENVSLMDHGFEVQSTSEKEIFKLVIGAYGKRSSLDKRLNRDFINKRSPYVGVKYHIRTDFPSNRIALHNFQDGYCGISKIENDTYNLCYLSHRSNLKKSGNISDMEQEVLYQNPYLKSIFQNSDFIFNKPLVINEISFESKSLVENGILMSGDAAGMITPLCGNGMAMAIHSAKILSETIIENWKNDEPNREFIENQYSTRWRNQFAFRLTAGRRIQGLFGSRWSSNLAVRLIKFKPVANRIVVLTHGKEF